MPHEEHLNINLDLVQIVGVPAALLSAAIDEGVRYDGDADGWWRASHATLGKRTGMPVGRVRGAVRKLREAGLIEQESRSGLDRALRYRFTRAGRQYCPSADTLAELAERAKDAAAVTIQDDES